MQVGDGPLILSERFEDQAAGRVDRCSIGRKSNGTLGVSKRKLGLPGLEIRPSADAVTVGVKRLNSDRCRVVGDGSLEFAFAVVDEPANVASVGAVRVKVNNAIEIGERAVEIVLGDQRLGAVQIGGFEFGVEADGFAVVGYGAIVCASRPIRVAARMERHR